MLFSDWFSYLVVSYSLRIPCTPGSAFPIMPALMQNCQIDVCRYKWDVAVRMTFPRLRPGEGGYMWGAGRMGSMYLDKERGLHE